MASIPDSQLDASGAARFLAVKTHTLPRLIGRAALSTSFTSGKWLIRRDKLEALRRPRNG
jgi:hypothetical protein